MKRFIFLVITLSLLNSCKKEGLMIGMHRTPYMISVYIILKEISCFTDTSEGKNVINLWLGGDHISSNDDRFDYFNKLYKDTSFNMYNYPSEYTALAYPFDKITLSCNTDYDATHPAGMPLDDIVKLKFSSYWDFIQSGYKYPKWYKKPEWESGCALNYEYYLSEINYNNTKLMTPPPYDPHIIFTSTPAALGEYCFTLKLTTNGETFTTTFTHTFE